MNSPKDDNLSNENEEQDEFQESKLKFHFFVFKKDISFKNEIHFK